MNAFNLIKNITKIFQKNQPQKQEATTTGYIREASPATILTDIFTQNMARKAIIADCKKMYNEDSRIEKAIQIMAGEIVGGGFEVQMFQEGEEIKPMEEKAKQIIDRTIKNCWIRQKLLGWIIALIRDGDLWLENEVSSNEIVRITKLEAMITRLRVDANGRTIENGGNIAPDDCYYQEDSLTGQEIKKFSQWQIIHLKWMGIDGDLFGQPQFASCRLLYKQLKESEKDQWIRRKIRAGLRRHHKIGTSDNPKSREDIKNYIEQNKDTLNNPLSVSSDFYSDGSVEIKDLQGDANLDQIADIIYQQDRLLLGGRIPKGMLPGFERDINRDVLEDSEKALIRFVININETVINEGLRRIFDLALLLEGINPDAVSYEIIWGSKRVEDKDKLVERELKKMGRVQGIDTTMKNLGIKNPEAELEKIKADLEDFPQVPYEIQPKFVVASNPMGLTGSLTQKQESIGDNGNYKELIDRQMDFVVSMADLKEKLQRMVE